MDDDVARSATWVRLRRPDGLVEQTRRLFWLAALLSLVLTLLRPVTSGNVAALPVVAAGVAGFVALWSWRYLHSSNAVALDAFETVALLAMVVFIPDPLWVLTFLFPAVWFRSLYGSTRRVVTVCVLWAAAILVGPQLWLLVPGRVALPLVSTATSLPVMALTLFTARYLCSSLFAREQAQRRDAVLVSLGNELIGVTDRDVIRARARECVGALCRSTPGLRALVVRREPDGTVSVQHRAGPFRNVPATLPRGVLPLPGPFRPGPLLSHTSVSDTSLGDTSLGDSSLGDPARAVPDTSVLDEIAGIDTAWRALPLPAEGDGWILLGMPSEAAAEAIVSVRSLVNQVTLAMRTSEAHQDLSIQAHTDPLTGLANRSAFTAALESALVERDLRFALLFLDLDDFKVVNDGLGHAAGDELLCRVADRLRAAVRPGDVCARIGGDEFAVLLVGSENADPTPSPATHSPATHSPANHSPANHSPATHGAATHGAVVDDAAAVAQRLVDLVAVAQRLVDLVAKPVSLDGRMAQVGASVGLAFASTGVTGEQLVQQADVAMYAAKAQGKNRVQVFDPALLRGDGRAAFEAELALAVGAGQLVVHYQPIMSVADGRCVAVEALVRWQHPVRGLLAPAEFIPTAERTGAIVGIGATVLRRACADVTRWSRTYGPLAVHVNVSAAQLTDPGFLEVVRSALAEFELAPKQLVLEITETMFLDSADIMGALDLLIAAGVAVAIDDFGTGYSALSTLRALPLDIVKIDKSFITGGPTRAADEAVVEAIVHMAGRLGLRIVAEGVERVDQQQFLVSIGADAVQGFLHLRPTAAEEFGGWLHSHGSSTGKVGATEGAGSGADGATRADGSGGTVTDLDSRRIG